MESLESQSTLRSDGHDTADSASYHDIDDDSLFADFKMPDLSVSILALFMLVVTLCLPITFENSLDPNCAPPPQKKNLA